MSSVAKRYRTSLAATLIVASIGIWPALIAPLGRAYIAICARYLAGAPFGHHCPPLVVAFLAPVAALLIVAFLFGLLRQLLAQRSLCAAAALQRDDADERLRQIVRALALTGRVHLSRDQAVYAFCSGLIRPRIYLSRGLVELLTVEELEAVLWHERQHLIRRDPLRYFIADLSDSFLPFFPALATLSNRLRINAELAADRASLSATSINVLVSALVKVMRVSPPAPQRIAVVSLSPTDARIAALAGRRAIVAFDRSDVLVSVGVALTALAVLTWLFVQPINLPPACNVCPPF